MKHNDLMKIRIKRNLTQSKVADMANISREGYCNIENGKRRPSPEVAMRIADVLGFNWTQFYEKSDDVDAFEDGSERDGGN